MTAILVAFAAFVANALVGGVVTHRIAERSPGFRRWVEDDPTGGLGRLLVFELWPLMLYWWGRRKP